MDVSQGYGRIGINVVVVLVILLVLRFLYTWLNGSGELQDSIVYNNTRNGLLAMSSSELTLDKSTMPALYGGGEYSISTWIYINNWGVNGGNNKVFLRLSGGGGGFSTLVMYLGQNVNKVGIRVSCDTSDTIGTPNIIDDTQMSMIVNGITPYTDIDNDFKKCDIESVDLQRWVNITTVLSGRTLDVYIDGKLSRSCVLNGLYMVDGDVTSLALGGPLGFGGYIGQTRAANYAYSPDQVYSIYMNGPTNTSFFGIFGSVTMPTVPKLPPPPTFVASFTAPSISFTPPSVSIQ